MSVNTKYESKRTLKPVYLYRALRHLAIGAEGEIGRVKYPNVTWWLVESGDVLLFLEKFENIYNARIPVKKLSAVFFNLRSKTFFILEDDNGYWDDALIELPYKHPLEEHKVNTRQNNQL